MAEKTSKQDEPQEGDRLPGEEIPKDDSHIAGQIASRTIGEDNFDDEGDEGGEGEQAPELISTMIGGVEYMLTPEAAAAYQSERDQIAADRQSTDHSFNDMLNGPPADTQQDEDELEDIAAQFYADPKKALAAMEARIRSNITHEVTTSYHQDQAVQQFWTDFYTEHPDLKDEDRIVKTVMSQSWDGVKNLKGKDARNKVAELTKRELLRIANKMNKGAPKGDSTNLEGDTTPASTTPRKVVDNTKPETLSLSAAIRERKRARRANA